MAVNPYFLYMAEAEGVTDIVQTRDARIHAAVKDLISAAKQGKDINGPLQDVIFQKYGLDSLSVDEQIYIERAVERAF